MISDDVAGLLMPDAGPAVRFRQGTVTAWNANTGQNTIDVGGGTLTDVPILNTGEAIALKAGHIVGLLVFGKTWFILGRITPPNSSDFASASVAFASESAFTSNFSVPNALATRASVTLDVPPWADEAAVIATSTASILNTSGVDDFAFLWTLIDGATSIAAGSGFSSGASVQRMQNMTSNYSEVVVNPGSTISVAAQLGTNGGTAWAADAGNRCALSAIAIFRSTV